MSTSGQHRREADVVILTAIPLEYQAVLQVEAGACEGSRWEEEKGPNGLPVAFRAFQSASGRPLRVAVSQAGDMGAVSATNALLPLVDVWRPRCVAMCGVCAGRPGKTNLGDVIAAERLFFHDTGKRLPEEVQQDLATYNLRPDWKVALEHFGAGARFREEAWWKQRPIPSEWQENWVLAKLREGVDPSAHPELDVFCPQWERVIESLWKSGRVQDGTLSLSEEGRGHIGRILIKHRNRLPDLTPSGAVLPFQVHVAPMGSGSQVIEDEHVWSFVSQSMRKTLGLEMEAAALGALVHAQRDRELDALVMKGVMDFANHGRDDHFKAFAARASAECLLAFLREHLQVEVVPGTDDLLSPGTEPLPDNPPPSALLNARYEVVPFDERGREDILADLERWCDEGSPVAVRLLHAEGGVGKTRLALEWARRRSARGWAAGFLAKEIPEDWFERLWARGQPVLVVIDYAESRSDLRAMLQRVLRYARQEGAGSLRRMRLLLLARNRGDWWEALRQADTALDAWLGETPPRELLPLAMERSARERVFHDAAERFARRRGRTYANPGSVALSDGRFVRVLYLHMAALAWVEGLAFEANTLMDVVLDHEERFWDTRLQQSDWALSAQRWLARQVLAAATLRGGFADASTASRLLHRLLGRALSSREEELLRLLHRIYQHTGRETSPYLPALEPDLLGEGMVVRAASPRIEEDRLPADWIDRVLPPGEEARVVGIGLEVLGRASAAWPDVVSPWLERLLAGPLLHSRAGLALEVAKAVGLRTASSVLGAVLADRLNAEGDVALAEELVAVGIPFPTVSLGRIAEWTSRTLLKVPPAPELERTTDRRARLLATQGAHLNEQGRFKEALPLLNESVGRYRVLAKGSPHLFWARLSDTLASQSHTLSRLGRHGEALRVQREVVELRRGLAKLDPRGFQRGLATALRVLGANLCDLGRHEQAAESLGESIEILRSLAPHGDVGVRSELADSLDELGRSLLPLKRHEEALAVTREAVDLLRVLVQLNADVIGSSLGDTLDHLAGRLSVLGRHEEALELTREAVANYRVLVKLNPGRLGAELATSIDNLGNHLGSMGRKEEALAAGREAIELLRVRVKDNPEAFQPYLAKTLANQCGRLVALERYAEAVEIGREAVALYRPLMERHPDVSRLYFAHTLNNQRLGLRGLGRREEERELLLEELTESRLLARSDPETYQPEVAGLLDRQRELATALNRPEEALEATREAADIYRALVKQDPGTYRLRFMHCLHTMDPQCTEQGRNDEALTVRGELVEGYRVLAEEEPGTYQPELARNLLLLGWLLKTQGQKQAALEATREGIGHYRLLVERDLETFLPAMGNGLLDLARLCHELKRNEEGLNAARELVALERRLEQREPDRAAPILASHFNLLGIHLSAVGQYEEALEVTLESVRRFRVLVPRDPETLAPQLADSLRDLGHRFLELGRGQEAVEAAREALGLYRSLSHHAPIRPRLADCLRLLGRAWGKLRRWEDSQAATQEAAGLYFALAEVSPEPYLLEFVNLLSEMCTRLMAQARYEEAVLVLREQVELSHSLARNDTAGGIKAGFAGMLINLCISLTELGRDGEARAPGEQALEVLWPLFQHDRDAHARDTAMVIRRLEWIYAATRQPIPPGIQERMAEFKRLMRP